MKQKLFNRDCAGVAISSLCLLHCVALPLAPVLFPAFLPFLSDSILQGHTFQTQELKNAPLVFLEYLFWALAFLATSFSLKKLLRPHTCHPHHPQAFVISSQECTIKKHNRMAYKKWALGLSGLGWLWFLVVVLNHLPHLLTVVTSVFLVASHVCALVFSIKTAKINRPNSSRLAPSVTNV